MGLIINTVHGESATIFNVIDEDQNVIASFNTKGGYTLADAQKIVDEDKAREAQQKKLFDITIRRTFTPEYQAKWRASSNYPDHEDSTHPEWSASRDEVAARWAKNHAGDRSAQGYNDAVTEIREVPEAEVAERRAKLQSWHRACCALAVTTPCVCHVSYICPVHGSRHVGTHD